MHSLNRSSFDNVRSDSGRYAFYYLIFSSDSYGLDSLLLSIVPAVAPLWTPEITGGPKTDTRIDAWIAEISPNL